VGWSGHGRRDLVLSRRRLGDGASVVNALLAGPLEARAAAHHGEAQATFGVAVRVLQRILALTAAIWHDDHTGQPTARSLVTYDH
jgi:hypothetical protein